MTKIDSKKAKVYLVAFAAMFMAISTILFPEVAFQASLSGLNVWFQVVFPALLPFFIMCELLMGLGVVNFIGVLLEPLMRPIFNVPGAGGFAMAMGLTSGYPMGSKITARLRRDGLCTRTEAERLMTFTNTADPLFMIGAVAVGMLGIPSLGVLLVIAHYVSVMIIGIAMRFYKRGDKESPCGPATSPHGQKGNILHRALNELYKARESDKRPFSQLLTDSVRDSINSGLVIGGCIVLFSVVVKVLSAVGVTNILAAPLSFLMGLYGNFTKLVSPMINGFFEISTGAQSVAQTLIPLSNKLVAISMIVAWGGLSVTAQVSSMVFKTDIRLKPYIIARMCHAVLAGFITWLLWTYGPWSALQTSAIAPLDPIVLPGFWATLKFSCSVLAKTLAATSVAALTCSVAFKHR